MNALLSFTRTGKSDKRTQNNAQAADPLLDSKVMLDEIPEEHFSTLRFLDIKREEENKRETAVVVSTAAEPQNKAQATPQPAAHTTVTSKPSRMQVFKDRVAVERQDSTGLPFSSKGKTASHCARLNLADAKTMETSVSPVRALLQTAFVQAASGKAALLDEAQTQRFTSHASIDPANSNANMHANSVAAHQRLAAHANFCLTRSHENLATVIETYLADSSTSKPLLLQRDDAVQFDFCAGGSDLFVQSLPTRLHRLTETDDSRTLSIAGANRIALDSLTASHPLRQRTATEAPMSHWFTEDGLACDIGVSPIETFVQAELLHTRQQVQRMMVQMRRLSLHLQQHCAHLSPLEAMHHAEQADAWTVQYGQPAAASLYRLLECTLTQAGAPSTVHEFFMQNPTQLPAFNTVNWPHVPAGLQLLQTLAELAKIATHTAPHNTTESTHAEANQTHLFERLAVLDVLMRDPAFHANAHDKSHDNNNDTAISASQSTTRIVLTENCVMQLRSELSDRLGDLKQQLETAGLARSAPHLEGKVRNADKHA